VTYHGHDLVYVIDDLDGIEASYEFAGIMGLRPEGLTLRQLWRMANGRAKQIRTEALQMVCLAFNESLDIPRFLATGQIAESVVGKPIELPEALEEQVRAEVERIRRENPDLPKFASQQ
jgi:hypothetical protein